jgi:hypothetical protein
MAGAVERIEQEINALEDAIAQLATELYSAYTAYLTALGQAVRQQLILASYQVCTQGYPESFLKLSFAQRQHLQKALRRVASQAPEQLLSHLETSTSDNANEATTLVFRKPEELSQWQENIEEAIAQTLQTLSRNSNRLLQQSEILPHHLPEAVLEVAAKAEASGDSVAGPPNLLNLVIETQNSEESESATVTHIIALNLRLSEIEFADPTLLSGRKQMRNLLSRLSTMRREYQKKQRERTIAEAEAAWRTSWFEEESA